MDKDWSNKRSGSEWDVTSMNFWTKKQISLSRSFKEKELKLWWHRKGKRSHVKYGIELLKNSSGVWRTRYVLIIDETTESMSKKERKMLKMEVRNGEI